MTEEWRFCPRCGTSLEERQAEGRKRGFCPSCQAVVYRDPKVVVAAVIRQGRSVLLVRRNNEPGMGLWALPGGYVEQGEVVEEALKREVQEETGLVARSFRLVGLYSRPGDPVLLAAYSVEAEGEPTAHSPEVQEAAFFPWNALPPLAFPRDQGIITEGLGEAPKQ